ncbi:hypothetical protein TVAG_178460 [Trichomonas vaginalis G3]|uniref:Uncharacterized protein n=1 Tax=Trichomonas vaginalis (strain ATCC PRA-98 / G3) TaxID=412133 RepID=A2DIJ8_TRIV3|nr:CNH domain containing family [Trichomonas vaginalis G3]EAY19802.1 hypothetical protein TVAG_178460 [Trichomonas vaginalis G3]KAI5524006.1 CNH domain containing family [Trichomonas vaginalis G3]|eukprot:XP_001580788.1 hypothetical protein [Trichomonas vaginalis G3]
MTQEQGFDKINTLCSPLSSDILCTTHTESFIYFATKAPTICKYVIDNRSKGEISELQFTWSTPKAMQTIKIGDRYILLVLAGKSVYYLPEDKWPGKFLETPITNALFIAPSDNHEELVVVEPKEIGIYRFSNNNLEKMRSMPHKFRPLDLAVGISHFVIVEKGAYHKFDFQFKKYESQNMQIKSIRSIKGKNNFAVSYQNTVTLLFPDKEIDPSNLNFTDEIVYLEIIPPYIFVLTYKALIIKSTIGTICEEYPIPFKLKYPCVEIMPNFNVVITNKNNTYISRYNTNGPDRHIFHLIYTNNTKQWENAITFCRIIKYPDFRNDQKLSDIYLQYSENLVSAQRYSDAFEKFQMSMKHPFAILKRFTTFATQDLKKATMDDIQKTKDAYTKVLDTLKDLPDTSRINPEKVYDAIKELNQITQSDEEIPDASKIYMKYEDYAREAKQGIQSLDEVKKNADDLLTSRFLSKPLGKDQEAIMPLQQYLKNILKNETNSTCKKIYNTMLFQCYARTAQQFELSKEIKNNPPIFFTIVKDTFINLQQQDALIDLCELHGQHDIAIRFILGQHNIDRAISYLRNSKDCLTQGKIFFDEILKELTTQVLDTTSVRSKTEKSVYPIQYIDSRLNKASEIFCSPTLMSTDIDTVVHFLQKNDKVDEELRNNLLAHFLEFAIYDRGLLQKSIAKLLVDVYLNLLKEKSKFGSSKSLISQEKDPIKSYREGLKKILETIPSSEFDVDIITSIDNMLIEEKLIAYRKIKSIEHALDLITKSEKRFTKGEERLEYGLYLLDCYYDKENPSTMEIYNKYLFEMRNTEEMKDYVAEFVNKCADRIKPDAAIDFIDLNTSISDISEFLKYITTSDLNTSRLAQLKNGLLDTVKREKEQQLKYLKGGFIEVGTNTKCAICGKPINDSVFYVMKDNFVTHAYCRPNSDKK